MLYSKNGAYPTSLPFRIVLSNGMTRTDPSTFTPEELADAGYIAVDNFPSNTQSNQVVEWTGTGWNVRNMTEQELIDQTARKWYEVRAMRDKLLTDLDWRFLRYQSQVRLGLTPTDDIVELDTYAQALRDITLQSDPDTIEWPQSNF